MTAKEIRVGNIIAIYPERINVEVMQIQTEFLSVHSHASDFDYTPTYSDCYGIPLSGAVLSEHGFSQQTSNRYYRQYWLPNKIAISLALEDVPYGYNAKRGCFYIGDNHKDIKYLHELQNYLYSVYNYELTRQDL